jgi:predicted Zn finger-like uncharacterized protein
MNNACPSCGAVYAVSVRDVGRKLKCKKCSTALSVTDAGLVSDTPSATLAADDFTTKYDSSAFQTKTRRSRIDSSKLILAIGGLPTLLFGIGLFLVIVFYFMPRISEASVNRAKARLDRIELEAKQKLRKDLKEQEEIDKLTTEAQQEYFKNLEKRRKEIAKELKPQKDEANDDIAYAEIDRKRSEWWDRYGLMFGFLFLSFGCLGYIRTEQNLLVKIVGAAILILMMLFVFVSMGGCRVGG